MKIVPALNILAIGLAVGFNTGLKMPRTDWVRFDTRDTNSAAYLVRHGGTVKLPPDPLSLTTNGFSVLLVR